MPGGKGVNVARALKLLGQPVIATGIIGGATGTRIIEALNDESILNAFVRIREESRTNMAVLDPTTGVHTEINERGPSVTDRELELFEQKLLYLARGASICVFAGSLPRGLEPDTYAQLIRSVRKLGVTDGRRHRRRAAEARGARRARRRLAERARGRGAGRARVRRRSTTAPAPSSRSPARARHEAIMTVPDGCYAYVREEGGHALYRVTIEPLEAQSPIGSGDAFLAGYVAARYQGGRRSSACASASPAAPSRPSTSAPGSSIRRRVERLLDGRRRASDVDAARRTSPERRISRRPESARC